MWNGNSACRHVSRLTRREIHGVLRALRNLNRRDRCGGEVVASPGEILSKDEDKDFRRDSATDDTRVRTAVAWLEEAQLLSRNENHVRVFPSSLRVSSVEEVRQRLRDKPINDGYRRCLTNIAETLINANADEGISTDMLMVASGLSSEGVRGALYDLERFGIASNDTELTAFVHVGVRNPSHSRLTEANESGTAAHQVDARGRPRPGGRRLGAAEPARRLPATEERRPPPCPARARDPHDPRHRSRRARRRRPRQPHAAQTRRGEPPGDPQTRMVLAGRHGRAPPQRRFPAARPLAGAEPAGQSGQRPARPHDSRGS